MTNLVQNRPLNRWGEARSVLRGAVVNGRALVAMIYLEASRRFGSGPFSYVWTLVEPSILIAGVLFMRSYIKTYNPAFGESSVLFLLTGLLTFRMTRNTINKSAKAISANKNLFGMGFIKPPDAVIARTIVEYGIWVFIQALFFSALHRILGTQLIADFPAFVLALLSIFFFCLGLTMVNATFGALVPIWRSLWKIATFPLLFMSGVVYVPATMPPEVQNIIKWNPFLHCIEAIRSASYLDYITMYDPVYLNTVSFVLLTFGLGIERLFRKEILRAKNNDDDEEDLL